MRKGEIACNKQFLLFSQCFLPYTVLIFHFKCTLKCRLQFVSIWTGLKFVSSGNGLNSRITEYRSYNRGYQVPKKSYYNTKKKMHTPMQTIVPSIIQITTIIKIISGSRKMPQ